MGVTVKGTPYSNYLGEVVERTYTATLINVVLREGEWIAIISVDGEIRTIPATDMVEWEGRS